jgi:preprotein translocase subunit SecE
VSQTSTGDVGGRSVPGVTRGPFGRLALFGRQVVAELRKVVRPTRSELITYTTVCLVFVVAVMAFVASLDLALGTLIGQVFGGSPS